MDGMTSTQFTQLLNFYQIEPFGEFRDELRNGKMMAMHHNMNRDEKKKAQPFMAKDFMDFQEPEIEKIYTMEELEEYADKVFREPTKEK